MVNYLSSIFLIANMKLTSLAVIGPCNFWPFNISFSSTSIDFPLVTKASDTLRLRPPKLNFKINQTQFSTNVTLQLTLDAHRSRL